MLKKQDLMDVFAALVESEKKINHAKAKVAQAEERLSEAIERTESIVGLDALCKSAVANLKGLERIDDLLLKEKDMVDIGLFYQSEEDEICQDSKRSFDQCRRDYLVEKYSKIVFRTDSWECVTVISKRRAITFAHDIHSTLKVGDYMKIHSMESSNEYNVKVSGMSAAGNWILLESEVDLCEEEPPIGGTADGRKYIQLGLSARSQNESYVSVSNGVFYSCRINNLGQILGSAGANPGDSGGPCIDESSGDLIGMNVGSKNIHISGSGTVSEAYDKASSRFASRAHIIPVGGLKFFSP